MALPVLVVLAICQTGAAQTPGVPELREVAAYEFLLQGVAALNHSVAVDPLVKPSIQEALNLTDQEADALKAIAADYETKHSQFLNVVRPLRMEALLQSLDSGRVTGSLALQINDLETEHAKMISGQIQRLKVAFGVPRFEVLDAIVLARFPQ